MISIVMPMFNSSNWIEETLISIREQSYENFECIIVDDGSTDLSIEIVKKFIVEDQRFTLYKRPENLKKGPSSCRNFGCSLVKGDFIQFFDSDDIMHLNHLEKKINAIADFDFVLCKLQYFQGSIDYDLLKNESTPDIIESEDLFEAFVSGDFEMMMVAPMWKTEVLKKHLPFNEQLHILEDHELYCRILCESRTYKIVNEVLIYYRQSANSSMNRFYSKLQTGIDSYLAAKKTVLDRTQSKKVKLAILKMILGIMRMGLAQKDYKNAKKCFQFIKSEKLAYSLRLKSSLCRIEFFYMLFKLIGRGDTFGKRMLKL